MLAKALSTLISDVRRMDAARFDPHRHASAVKFEFDWMKVIIFENDLVSRDELVNCLTDQGSEVFICREPAELSSSLEVNPTSIVFLNVDVPEGLTACSQMTRKDGQRPGWVVGLASSIAAAAAALEAGANDVLWKPVDRNAARLRLVMAEQRLPQASRRTENEAAQNYRLTTRASQQAAVAAIGQCALVGLDVPALMTQVVSFLGNTLEVESCAIFEYMADTRELAFRDGFGFGEESRAGARRLVVEGTPESRALDDDPVIIQEWSTETRFKFPETLKNEGVRSSVFLVIAGPERPFGLLVAHSRRPGAVTEDDLHFVQAIATILSLTVERRRSEAAIQRLAAFARCNPNPVVELAADGELTYANEAALDLAEQMENKPVLALLPAGSTEIVQRCLAAGENAVGHSLEIARRTFLWSFFPIPDREVVHCYGEEVTGKLNLEQQLRQLQKMECVGQLAAGLAHDYNNVLTIIQGHGDILLADKTLAPKKVMSLQKILGAVDKASSLTRQLLTFSRRQIVQTVPLDLNDCLATVMKMLDRVISENIELTFTPSQGLPAVMGDSGMLDQVLMNLAVNARDAMHQGGRLVVTTSLVEVDDAHVQRRSQARAGRFVCLSVTDTGSGMDAETLAHIFEPFFTTKGKGKGTGLGLATVYGIVQQHQGWIEVISKPGEGTTFLIFLPCSDQPAPAAVGKSQMIEVQGGTETVLLVEDEPSLRELGRMILQNLGYVIIEAASGAEALKVWTQARDRVDLLLTDLVMPEGVSGLELGRQLADEKPDLKIIYVSGYSSEVNGKEEVQQQICFLQKPYAAQALARIVREVLDGSPPNAGVGKNS